MTLAKTKIRISEFKSFLGISSCIFVYIFLKLHLSISYRFCDYAKVCLLRYIHFLHDYLFSKLNIKHSVVFMV